MTTVYIVTEGGYSDYSIKHVFADKALAEEYAARQPYDRDVEPYEIQEELPVARMFYQMFWYADQPESQGHGQRNPFENSYTVEGVGYAPEIEHEWKSVGLSGDRLMLRVSGFDQDRVKKVFGEQRGKFLAETNDLT